MTIMATDHTITRRSLLTALPAIGMAGSMACATTVSAEPQTPIMRLFREWDGHRVVANEIDAPEAEGEAASDRCSQIKAAMMIPPSTCMADFAAKLITDSSDGIFETGEALLVEARMMVGP